MEQQIVAKEREGLAALKTGDLLRFGHLTAEDAILVEKVQPARQKYSRMWSGSGLLNIRWIM
jgi:hypothetical protein